MIERTISTWLLCVALSSAMATGSWESLGNGVGGEFGSPSDMVVWDNNLIVTGGFATAGGIPAMLIASWDGTEWDSLGGGLAMFNSLAVHMGQLVVDGAVGGGPRSLLSWNGVSWDVIVQTGVNAQGDGNNLASFQGGLWQGDTFYASGEYWNRIWQYTGAQWISENSWVADQFLEASGVSTVENVGSELFVHLQPDGDVWSFDGSMWLPRGYTGVYRAVAMLVVNGTVYAGGIDWTSRDVVARWSGGTSWDLILDDPAVASSLRGMGAFDSRLAIAGWYSGWGVALWDGVAWSRVPGLLNNFPNAVTEYNGELIVCGRFTEIDGVPIARIARYVGNPTTLAITSFDAEVIHGGVSLNWSIDTDERFGGFGIVRRVGDSAGVLLPPGRLGSGIRSYLDTDVTPGTTYSYVLVAVGAASGDVTSQRVEVTVPGFGAELHQNIPNPFNPETTIRFVVPDEQRVTLRIYDAAGRRVRTLVDALYSPGDWSVTWDGTDERGGRVSSGVYYYRMQSGTTDLSRKMVLLK